MPKNNLGGSVKKTFAHTVFASSESTDPDITSDTDHIFEQTKDLDLAVILRKFFLITKIFLNHFPFFIWIKIFEYIGTYVLNKVIIIIIIIILLRSTYDIFS